MALRSANLLSDAQRLFGSPTSTGANVLGGWTATASTSKATTTLTLSSANNGTYSSTADKTFTIVAEGRTHTFIANANFTVSGGSATVAVTAKFDGYNYNDVANGGDIPNSSTFTTSVNVGGSATAGAISGGQGSPFVRLHYNNAMYFQYIPDDYDNSVGNMLAVMSLGTNDITILSPIVSLGDAENLFATTMVVNPNTSDNLSVISSLQFFETETGSVIDSTNTATKTVTNANATAKVNTQAIAPVSANFVRLKFVISKEGGTLANRTKLFIFDPVIADFTFANDGDVTKKAYYLDLPNFMRLDDEQVSNLVNEGTGTKTQGTLTLSGCTNATYAAETSFTVVVDNNTYEFLSTGEFTVSGGAATVPVVSKFVGKQSNDVTHGGVIPNGSNQFTFSGIGSGSVTAGTGDTNGLINGTNSTKSQLPLPLLNYLASLLRPIDVVNESAKDFDYIHATEGTLSRSTLSDPRTAPASYLPWIASVTGSSLLSSASGFTPWTALEAYDGDSGGDPGEWEDFEVLANWNAVQDLDPDFFDELESHRNQLTTGFTGIQAGKIETMEDFLDTVVDTDTPSNFTVRVTNDKFNNPFKIQSLVDPAVDPDAGGSLIKDAIDAGAPAGAVAASTNNVIESGEGSYDFSALLTADNGSPAGHQGFQILGDSDNPYREFIDDRDGFNRSILLTTATGNLGGGIGTSQYTGNKVYLYGESGKLTVANDATFNIGGDDTAVDIIVELTNFTPFSASAWTSNNTSTSGQREDWFLREKRLLVCGTDTTSNHNDWAFYVVSGHTPSADPKMRLLWVEGYRDENDSNHAYSSEIDMSTATQYGPIIFRVSKSASDVVTFYAQSSLYDDWASNALTSTPSTAITPSSQAASVAANAGIQVGGTLSNSLWTDASALPAAFSRVMVNNAVFSFTGSGTTSSENHAYVDGGGVNDFGNISYTPLLDIDVSKASAVYASSFDATKTVSGAAVNKTVTVGQDGADNDVTLVAMEPSAAHGNLFYGGSQDTLAVSGLSSASYKIRVTTYSDGTDFPNADNDGDLDFTDIAAATATSFSLTTHIRNRTIYSIDVVPAADSFGSNGAQASTSVAYFRPDTIGAAANPLSATGTDNKSKTWTLTRVVGNNSTNWIPSQAIDKSFIQPYKGKFTTAEPPAIEYHTPFSIGMQIRRCWTSSGTGTEHNVYSLLNGSNQGLKIFFEDAALKAVFTDGTFSETATWTQTSFGGWDNIVVQRDPSVGLRIYANGTLAQTAEINTSLTAFSTGTNAATFGEGTNSQYNPWFALSQFAFFDRFLSTNEISLLNSQLT